MHKALLSMVSVLALSGPAYAGFNVVDEDVAGAHYGNAQHAVFKQAMEGSNADLTSEDKEIAARSSRAKLDNRYYFRFRGSPLGRLNVKKFVQTFNGVSTVLANAKFKSDEMETSFAAGFSMSNAISLEIEMISFESTTFTKSVTLKDTTSPAVGTLGVLSGRIKPRMYLFNGDYSFEPMQVTLGGATIVPYAMFGVGLTEINPTKIDFNTTPLPALAGVATAPARKRLGFSVGAGWKARATNDLTLDMAYRLHYLGQGRLVQIGSSSNYIMAERVIAHGLFLGGSFHF